MGERGVRNAEVGGSSPPISTTHPPTLSQTVPITFSARLHCRIRFLHSPMPSCVIPLMVLVEIVLVEMWESGYMKCQNLRLLGSNTSPKVRERVAEVRIKKIRNPMGKLQRRSAPNLAEFRMGEEVARLRGVCLWTWSGSAHSAQAQGPILRADGRLHARPARAPRRTQPRAPCARGMAILTRALRFRRFMQFIRNHLASIRRAR